MGISGPLSLCIMKIILSPFSVDIKNPNRAVCTNCPSTSNLSNLSAFHKLTSFPSSTISNKTMILPSASHTQPFRKHTTLRFPNYICDAGGVDKTRFKTFKAFPLRGESEFLKPNLLNNNCFSVLSETLYDSSDDEDDESSTDHYDLYSDTDSSDEDWILEGINRPRWVCNEPIYYSDNFGFDYDSDGYDDDLDDSDFSNSEFSYCSSATIKPAVEPKPLPPITLKVLYDVFTDPKFWRHCRKSICSYSFLTQFYRDCLSILPDFVTSFFNRTFWCFFFCNMLVQKFECLAPCWYCLNICNVLALVLVKLDIAGFNQLYAGYLRFRNMPFFPSTGYVFSSTFSVTIPDLSERDLRLPELNDLSLQYDVLGSVKRFFSQISKYPVSIAAGVGCLAVYFRQFPAWSASAPQNLSGYLNSISRSLLISSIPAMGLLACGSITFSDFFDSDLSNYGTLLRKAISDVKNHCADVKNELVVIVQGFLTLNSDDATDKCFEFFKNLLSEHLVNKSMKALVFAYTATVLSKLYPKSDLRVTSSGVDGVVKNVISSIGSDTTLSTLIATMSVAVLNMLYHTAVGRVQPADIRDCRKIIDHVSSTTVVELMTSFRDNRRLTEISSRDGVFFNNHPVGDLKTLILYLSDLKQKLSGYKYLSNVSDINIAIRTLNTHIEVLATASICTIGPAPFGFTFMGNPGIGKTSAIPYMVQMFYTDVIHVLRDPVVLRTYLPWATDSGAISNWEGEPPTIAQINRDTSSEVNGCKFDANKTGCVCITSNDGMALNPDSSDVLVNFIAFIMKVFDNSSPADKPAIFDKGRIPVAPVVNLTVPTTTGNRCFSSVGTIAITTNTRLGAIKAVSVSETCVASIERRIYGSSPGKYCGFEMCLNFHPCFQTGLRPLINGNKVNLPNVVARAKELALNRYAPNANILGVYEVFEGKRIDLYHFLAISPPFRQDGTSGSPSPTLLNYGERPEFDRVQELLGNDSWLLSKTQSYLIGKHYLKYMSHIFKENFFNTVHMEFAAGELPIHSVKPVLVPDPSYSVSSTLFSSVEGDYRLSDTTPTLLTCTILVSLRMLLENLIPGVSYFVTLFLNYVYLYAIYSSLPFLVLVSCFKNIKPVIICIFFSSIFFSLDILAFCVLIFHVSSVLSGIDFPLVDNIHPFPSFSHGFCSYFFCCHLDENPQSYVLFRNNTTFGYITKVLGKPSKHLVPFFHMVQLFCFIFLTVATAITLNDLKGTQVFFSLYVLNVAFQDLISARRANFNLRVCTGDIILKDRAWYEAVTHLVYSCKDIRLLMMGILCSISVLVYNVVFPTKKNKILYGASATSQAWNSLFKYPLLSPDKQPDASRCNMKRALSDSLVMVEILYPYGWVTNFATKVEGGMVMPAHCFWGVSLQKGCSISTIELKEPKSPVRILITYGSGSFELNCSNLQVSETGDDLVMIKVSAFTSWVPSPTFDLNEIPVIYGEIPNHLEFGPVNCDHLNFLSELTGNRDILLSVPSDVRDVIKLVYNSPILREQYYNFLRRVKLFIHLSRTTDFKVPSPWCLHILLNGKLEVTGSCQITISSFDDESTYNKMTSNLLRAPKPSLHGDSTYHLDNADSNIGTLARCSVPDRPGNPFMCGEPVLVMTGVNSSVVNFGTITGGRIDDVTFVHGVIRAKIFNNIFSSTFQESHNAIFGFQTEISSEHSSHCWVNHAGEGQRYEWLYKLPQRGNYFSDKPSFVNTSPMKSLGCILNKVTGVTVGCTARLQTKDAVRRTKTKVTSRYTEQNPDMRLPSCHVKVRDLFFKDWEVLAHNNFRHRTLSELEPWGFNEGVCGDDLMDSLQLHSSTGHSNFSGELSNHVNVNSDGRITADLEGSPLMHLSHSLYLSMCKPGSRIQFITTCFPKDEKNTFELSESDTPEDVILKNTPKDPRMIQNFPTSCAISSRVAFSFMLRFFKDFNAIFMTPYGRPPYLEASVIVDMVHGESPTTAASIDISKMDASIGGDVMTDVMTFWRKQLVWMGVHYDSALHADGRRTYKDVLPLFDNCVNAITSWWSVTDGYATFFKSGNASGSPITTHLNIHIGVFAIHNVCVTILTENHFSLSDSWLYIKKHVHICVYGDDIRIVVSLPGAKASREKLSWFTAGYIVSRVTDLTGFKITVDDPKCFLQRVRVGEFLQLVPTSLSKCFGDGLTPKKQEGCFLISHVAQLISTTQIELSCTPDKLIHFVTLVLLCEDPVVCAAVDEMILRAFQTGFNKFYFGIHPSMASSILRITRREQVDSLIKLCSDRELIGKPSLVNRGVFLVGGKTQNPDNFVTLKDHLPVEQKFVKPTGVLIDNLDLRSRYMRLSGGNTKYLESSLIERCDFLQSLD